MWKRLPAMDSPSVAPKGVLTWTGESVVSDTFAAAVSKIHAREQAA
jgi:hypothetical protein